MPNTRRWRGNAPAIAQITTVTIFHVEDGVTYTLTRGGKSVSVTADAEDTLTTVMAALATAWNGEVVPQFSEITALASGSSLTLTADTAGVPFDVTATQTGTGGNAEVKTITISNSPTGGTWSYVDSTYGTASNLAYNISAADLQTALRVIYPPAGVTVTGSNGGPFTVTFASPFDHLNIPAISFVNTSLTGGNATVNVVETRKGAAGTSEVQTITFYGTPTGGTFTAAFGGFTTAALAYNISSANLQTALRALPSIGSGNISVSGSAGGPYTCTFAGALANTAVSAISIDPGNLTGGSIFGTVNTTTPGVDGVNEKQLICINGGGNNEIVSIERSGTVSGGTFTLTYGSGGSAATTSAIAYNAKLYEILEALETAIATKQGSSYRGPYFAPFYDSEANQTIAESGGRHLIQIVGDLGKANIDTSSGSSDKLAIDGSSLTGGGSYAFPGTTYSSNGLTGGSLTTSGTFYLRFGGQTTSLLTYTAAFATFPTPTMPTSPTAAQIQTALEALSTIGAGNVTVTAVSGTPLIRGSEFAWLSVVFTGALAGTPVSSIEFITDSSVSGSVYTLRNGAAGTSEVQTVTLSGSPSVGTFTLSYGSETTAQIAYNASAADVDTALEALSGIPAGGVTCSGGALPGSAVTVTFSGSLQFTNVSQLIINDAGLKVAVAETTPGVTTADEIQTISLAGAPHGGTATLTYSGQTTSALNHNSSAATIQTALEALSNLAPGDVVCTGGPWPAAVTLTFGGTLAATDVAALTGSGTSLNNGAVAETSVTPIIYPVTTSNSGPNDVNVAANWSDETLPVSGDTIVFDQGASPARYNLDKLATGLAAIYVYARYTGEIGLPEVNELFATTYYEFRPQYLVVDSPIVDIGTGDGNGSGRIKIQGVSGTTPTVNVYRTDTGLDAGIEALLLVLPNASSVVNVNRGSVGIAIYPGETSTVATLRVGFETNIAGDATVRCGSGVTLTTIEQSGGQLTTNSAVVTLNMTDGELIHCAGTFTTANIDQGTVRYISSGTLTTANVGGLGALDFRQDLRSRTVTNLVLHKGAEYRDPHGTVTLTNGADFVRCQPSDCVFEIKPNQNVTLSPV